MAPADDNKVRFNKLVVYEKPNEKIPEKILK